MKNKNKIDLKYRPRKCWKCRGKLIELRSVDINGVPYRFWHCIKCGEEIIDMTQLHESANTYRRLKKAKLIKISSWGNALAIRIPQEIIQKQKLKPGFKVRIFPEKNGFKIIPEKE